MKNGISVVINTLNEERNLPYALASVAKWADDIVVVDMYSKDRTCEIARDFGARVFLHDPVGYVEPAREFAVAEASEAWVLVLDADEIIPKKLAGKLIEISKKGSCDVCKLPRLNYFFGAPVRYSGWGPNEDSQVRFFRKGSLIFSSNIHSMPQVAKGARLDVLNYGECGAIVHFPYHNFSQFVKKLDTYTNIEAIQLKKLGIKPAYLFVIYAAGKEFLVRFVLKQGFRDGWRGFYLAVMMMFYKILTYAKINEMIAGAKEDVSQIYADIAQDCINEYD